MSKNIRLICLSILFGILLSSCKPAGNEQIVTTEEPVIDTESTSEEKLNIDESPQEETWNAVEEFNDHIELPTRNELQLINPDNIVDLRELADVYPYFPPFFQISADGGVGAIGDLRGIDIVNVSTGEWIDHIAVELPVSDFGIERFFQFNYDGSFIAVASIDEIQVWQIGGGLIYAAPYSRQFNTTDTIFGADIPQLALSPDGSLLAVSGIDFSSPTVERYFQVIDVLKNKVVYEWDGSDETPHGNLYDYTNLGFSADGNVLQTFDPRKFAPLSGTAHESFRFWATENWQEILPASDNLQNAFMSDGLLYALQNESVLEILDRRDGRKIARLEGTGCSYSYPCGVRFSNNGKYAAILDYSQETISYRRDLIAKYFQIWSLETGEMIGEYPLDARNLDGVLPGEDGSYQMVMDGSVDSGTETIWWTTTANFAGLTGFEDRITFSPQYVGLDTPDCYFCGTCELNLNNMRVVCGLRIGEMPVDIGEGLTARILGISDKWNKAFYCLDQDKRQQECHIFDMEDETILENITDIYMLRFSMEGDHAAFIDREEKALFVVDLATGKVSEIGAYQSRAWPVNPVFSTSGAELVYIIQNINSKDILSLEWVNAEERRVLRRANLENGLVDEPSALTWAPESELVAVGNTDGWIYILDQEKGKLIHSWQAETDGIIGLLFSRNGKLLISMNKSGIIKVWGVPK